ncbi:MAG: gamma-glutamylcyclotransferase family protein [Planctomycetota bacterium]
MDVIFGYGSLINPASANKTLGRGMVPDPFPTAVLLGYSRCWDYVSRLRREGAAGGGPARAIALNVTTDDTPPDHACNGVLIHVTDDEIERLDLREEGYDRVDVTAQVTLDVTSSEMVGHVVWTYVARPERRVLPAGAFIAERYRQIVEEGLSLYGCAFADAFHRTTRPSPLPSGRCDYPNAPVK